MDPKLDLNPRAPDTCDRREAYLFAYLFIYLFARKKVTTHFQTLHTCSMTHYKKSYRGDLFNSSRVAVWSGSKFQILNSNLGIKVKVHVFEMPILILRCLISYTTHHIKGDIQFGRVDAKITNNIIK